ncbi:50S ribosomal protein L32 [Candidatus Parcubacteria bacterium]|nr:50S ribosomal protein L32 [Candidatus Parcubacteria bacterium]
MVVRMRHTRAHTGNRRSHHALKMRSLSKCPKCNAPKMSHRVCAKCGTYKDKVVVDTMAKITKRQKAKEKAGKK